ncbi:MAG: N-succinylarginine dihydrolase, partial [Phycisphaerae bacterium]|nr:N-succinylarginine dihydrolase [Phycisphaerae bacterium]
RSIEAKQTSRVLRTIFADENHFAHHDPLPASALLGDEGAANHMRFADGTEAFVFGREGSDSTTRFPARQTRQACEAIARLHQLNPVNTFFVRQNPVAIDAGAFHNDVVAVSHGQTLFYHEKAFIQPLELASVNSICVREEEISLADAILSYMFNSQLVTLGDGTMSLVAPTECETTPAVRDYLHHAPFDSIRFVDVRQSMRNGGGPACLRLRVMMTEEERTAVRANVFFTPTLHEQLIAWVNKHYREALSSSDLSDPKLLDESRAALDELTRILSLGSIYDFQ